jgi:hypothetical protein
MSQSTENLKEIRQSILGIAFKFDFSVKLTSPGVYSRLRNLDIDALATYFHEWTHYIQYLSTSLGDCAAELERNLHLTKWKLCLELAKLSSKPLPIPITKLLLEDESIQNNPVIVSLINSVKILVECQKILHKKWSKEIVKIQLDQIRKTKPFNLDFENNALIYTTEENQITLPISISQIFEHAATANELIIRQGIVSSQYFNSQYFDYFALFLYLYQENQIDFIQISPNQWQITLPDMPAENGGATGALTLIYACCQIALMLYMHPRFVSPDLLENNSGNTGDISAEWIAQTSAFMNSSAHAFLKLILNLGYIKNILDTPGNHLNSAWLDVIDNICISLELLPYSKVLALQLSRAQNAEKTINERLVLSSTSLKDQEMFIRKLTQGQGLTIEQQSIVLSFHTLYTDLFYKRSTSSFQVLMENPNASIVPLSAEDKFPIPYIYALTDDGMRRVAACFLSKTPPNLIEIPYNVMSYYQEDHRVIDKILFDNDCACYRTDEGTDREYARASRAALECPHFAKCFDKPKNSLIGFCEYDGWKEVVARYMNFYSIMRD